MIDSTFLERDIHSVDCLSIRLLINGLSELVAPLPDLRKPARVCLDLCELCKTTSGDVSELQLLVA